LDGAWQSSWTSAWETKRKIDNPKNSLLAESALLAEDLTSPESGRRIEAPERDSGLTNAFQRRPNAESDQHFMVPKPLAALYKAEVPYQAVAAAAHACEPAILQSEHLARMHRLAIPSILDTNRFRLVHDRTNRGVRPARSVPPLCPLLPLAVVKATMVTAIASTAARPSISAEMPFRNRMETIVT
jgi:hypothetical protein